MKIIDKLKELEGMAAEKPWYSDEYGNLFGGDPAYHLPTDDHRWTEDDAQFIAESRNAMPALLMIAEGAEGAKKSVFYGRKYQGNEIYRNTCRHCGEFSDGRASQVLVVRHIEHKKDCPIALIEKGLKDLKEAGE